MFAFEVEPAFRGATYVDALQMIDADDGSPVGLDPSDVLTWRLFPLGAARGFGGAWGYGCGADYGFPGLNATAAQNNAAWVTLTLGTGLIVSPVGLIQWVLTEGQTLQLRRPEYRMRLDLTRYGQTVPILDTTLQVMD